MNGARKRMADWHASLRRISERVAGIQRSIDALDGSLQDMRTLAENYGMLMQVDIPFAARFLRETPAEVLVEALRDPELIDKMQVVIAAAQKPRRNVG
jgi:hypothetical protein